MATPLNQDIVRYLINTPEFIQYMDWVSMVIDDLNSVTGLEGKTLEEAGEEVMVRAKALERLRQIIAPFIEYRVKREPSILEIQKVKSNYGL